MFFVLSRKKLCSYFIAIGTVAILLSVSKYSEREKTIETATNLQTQNEINGINYIENEENILD